MIFRRYRAPGLSQTSLSPAARCPPPAAARHHHRKPRLRAAPGSARAARFSLLQIDVGEPEKSANPTQTFVIHNIIWRRTQLLAVCHNII